MASASASDSVVPLILLILVQLAYAWMNITSKLSILAGMNPLILVAYRQILGAVSIAPFAYWLERDKIPRMTKRIMVQILLSSLTGITGSQILYFIGLKYSTPIIACALTNLDTAFTFVLAILFKQENMGIKKSGVAKVVGTVLCIGGAIVLSFYHAKVIDIPESRIHWSYAEKTERGHHNFSAAQSTSLLGPVLLILNALVWSLWFIIQADMSKNFPVPYTSTTYTCVSWPLGSIQCVFIALCFDHSVSAWALHDAMRLASSLHSGVICTGISFPIISWTIGRKGPLYVSVFTPMQLILAAFISWAFIQEKLYVGTAIGSLLIVGGLYAFLWGKIKEVDNNKVEDDDEAVVVTLPPPIKKDEKNKNDMEMPPNGNGHYQSY